MKKPKSNVSVLRPRRPAQPAAMDPIEERFLRGYLKLPPEDQTLDEAQANPLYVNDLNLPDREIRPDRAIWLGLRIEQFRKTADPHVAIDIFAAAIETGIYPPVDVLRWVASGFDKWLSHSNEVDMDRALGLVGGRGQELIRKKKVSDELEALLFQDMDILMHLGATRLEAAELVAGKLAREDWNKTAWDVPEPGADTLHRKHSRRGQRTSAAVLERWLKPPLGVSNFLRRFELAQLPPKLRALL